MRKPLLLAVTVVTAALSGCNYWYNTVPSPDDLMHHISWFDHMIYAKSIAPYSSDSIPRDTPAGTVPVGGGEENYGTGNLTNGIPTYGFDTLGAKRVVRPAHMVASPAARSGKELFDTYCAVCHGAAATGFRIPEIPAPSLLTAQARGYSDGYIYSMIRYGRGGMPQYGDKIPRIDERWAVVDYLRSLQAAAPLPAPAAKGKP
jgi:mono/diheme cytochrome c family protein